MPQFRYGPFDFVYSGAYSGYGPTEVRGAGRQMYVVEHAIPAKEGGVIEYLGSQQSTYQLKGFIVQQEGGSTANLVLSGTAYVAINADDAKDFLKALRGSGIQLLLIESTYSNMSGYQNLYENGFFQIEKLTLALEAGRSYPYYPYAIDLRGATPATYGNSSGTAGFSGLAGKYYSGYIYAWQMGGTTSGAVTNGEIINTVGIYVNSVASGNLKVAVYSGSSLASGSNSLAFQTQPQAVHSGWNYFPIRPSFQSKSAVNYIYAFAGDAANSSGFVVAMFDTAGLPFDSGVESGIGFSSAFPTTFAQLSGNSNSGQNIDIVVVAGV